MKKKSKQSLSLHHVPGLERALVIIELLANNHNGLTLSEIAEKLRIPKNSVFRITMTLLDRGYLDRDDSSKRFALTRKLLAIGYAAIGDQNIVENAMDVMRELRDSVKETVLLGTLLENRGIVMEQVLGLHHFKFTVSPGKHLYLHTSAPCKAQIAFLPPAERKKMMERIELPRFNANTITSKKAFEEELDEIRQFGYAIDREEEFAGVVCIGAPVLDQYGYPVAAIWTTGPADRMPVSRYKQIGETVRENAMKISRRLGYGVL
jgi:DNA-binding IclR family transcriptional regulator